MSNDLNKLHAQIKQFAAERGWDHVMINVYNMLCNISEESGEVWNVIKWINNEEDMKEVISKNKDELEDGIGDLLWCIARLAIFFDVDMYSALEERLKEYKQRFPVEKVKGKKSNPTLGGFDGKYDGKISN